MHFVVAQGWKDPFGLKALREALIARLFPSVVETDDVLGSAQRALFPNRREGPHKGAKVAGELLQALAMNAAARCGATIGLPAEGVNVGRLQAPSLEMFGKKPEV